MSAGTQICAGLFTSTVSGPNGSFTNTPVILANFTASTCFAW